MNCIVIWVSAVVYRKMEFFLQRERDWADIYLRSSKLGHRFSKIYLVSCYISSVEIRCKVMAEML